MDMNQKMLMQLAKQLGFEDQNEPSVKQVAELANEYKSKNEQELLMEFLKMKKQSGGNPAQLKQQIAAIRTLRSVMNQEQRERLDQVLDLLEKE